MARTTPAPTSPGRKEPAETAKPRTSPLEFARQVRQEVRKITWPTRKETTITAIMVFLLTALLSVFFLAVDFGFGWLSKLLLGLGS